MAFIYFLDIELLIFVENILNSSLVLKNNSFPMILRGFSISDQCFKPTNINFKSHCQVRHTQTIPLPDRVVVKISWEYYLGWISSILDLRQGNESAWLFPNGSRKILPRNQRLQNTLDKINSRFIRNYFIALRTKD